MARMLRATDDHRRARIARRHGLDPAHRHVSIEAAAAAMTALHATEAATPYLALHARIESLTVDDVATVLYDERSLVRVMAMRRTLWIVGRDLVPAVIGSAGRRVADVQRRGTMKEAVELEGALGPNWIDDAAARILECLDGRELSAKQLRAELPELAGTFTAAPGTKWSTDVPTMTRLLVILSASGSVVRGHNDGHWRISKPLWTATDSWLGEPVVPMPSEDGYAEIVRRLLWTFGPVTEDDLVWWLGSTKGTVRAALADASAMSVTLDTGSTGWVLPDDTADLEVAADVEPWVALLPTLDPTTMGWRNRDFYLDPALTPFLFDRAGNAGTTAWVDGRIVGCWVQDTDERVRLILSTEVSADARRRLDVEVTRLDEFLCGEHIINVYTSPQMKHQPLP
jgi:hypothetical protein